MAETLLSRRDLRGRTDTNSLAGKSRQAVFRQFVCCRSLVALGERDVPAKPVSPCSAVCSLDQCFLGFRAAQNIEFLERPSSNGDVVQTALLLRCFFFAMIVFG
ncbi:hypothetical protein ACFL34_03925 [Candidatus Sumerlaeota bacterium]